jgi:hypothetical protein
MFRRSKPAFRETARRTTTLFPLRKRFRLHAASAHQPQAMTAPDDSPALVGASAQASYSSVVARSQQAVAHRIP